MDRSKPDRAGGGAAGETPLEHLQVRTLLLNVSRGGPQELAYYRLSPHQKREWETVEDIIEGLAKGRLLYSYGTIHADRIRSKYWLGQGEGRGEVGVTAVPTRNHLHEVLVCNVGERFHFVATPRDLSDAEVMEIWRDIDACLPHTTLVERHAYVHCAMVEMPGHDCFEVIFRAADSRQITAAVQDVLAYPRPPR